jgi:CheY-like chemotaxis protein
VQQSGGSISVRSAPFLGSTFDVLLPVTTEKVAEAPPAIAPLPSLRGTESILLIEDDDVVRKMVAGILTADGYSVAAAKSFATAVREPPRGRAVQLLIAPLSGEGEKAARKLLEHSPALRILCTSHPDGGWPLAGVPPKYQAAISKPYALSELLRAARKLLDAS